MAEFSAAFISITLSHHFQKDEVKKIVSRTGVDFGTVRDTMHKYSRRAEEKFFKRSTWAFLFIHFAKNFKAAKNREEKDEPIIAEKIEVMTKEALDILKSTFERELWDLRIDHMTRLKLKAMNPVKRLLEFTLVAQKQLLSLILLENLSVDVDTILEEKLKHLCSDDYRAEDRPSKSLLEKVFQGIKKP